MIINNAKVYRNGHFESASIEFDSHIRSFSPGEGMDACGAYICLLYTSPSPRD